MNVVIDESVDKQIVVGNRNAGLNAIYIQEDFQGVEDDFILQLANEQERILVTQDKDFGELVYRLKRAHYGVILIRLPGFSPEQKSELVVEFIVKHQSELPEAFTVIQPHLIRIRKLKM